MSDTHDNEFPASSPSTLEPVPYLRRPRSTPVDDDDNPFVIPVGGRQTRLTTRPTIGVVSKSPLAKLQGERQPLLAEEHESPHSPDAAAPDFGEEEDKDSWKNGLKSLGLS